MHTEVRYKPSFAVVFVTLSPGDAVIAESDAMASMTGTTRMRTRFNGGFFRGLMKKWFGGESLFVNEFTCDDGAQGAQVVLTQPLPGDIHQVELKGDSIFLTSGTYIASTPGVKLGLGWAGFASWWGGEGLFRLKAAGEGTLWFGGYGSVMEKDVKGSYVIDTGHILAYEPGVRMKVGLAGGIFSSFFGGEGFVSRVSGEGRVWMQTRSIDGLAAWANGHL